jgi:hypothetical protein
MTTHTTRRALIGGAGLAALGAVAAALPKTPTIAAVPIAQAPPSVDRATWDKVFKAMMIATAEDDAFTVGFDERFKTADKPTQIALDAEFERLGEVRYEATWALFAVPAPDRAALLWKTEYLFGDTPTEGSSCASWSSEVMNWYLADQRRLLGPEAR